MAEQEIMDELGLSLQDDFASESLNMIGDEEFTAIEEVRRAEMSGRTRGFNRNPTGVLKPEPEPLSDMFPGGESEAAEETTRFIGEGESEGYFFGKKSIELPGMRQRAGKGTGEMSRLSEEQQRDQGGAPADTIDDADFKAKAL